MEPKIYEDIRDHLETLDFERTDSLFEGMVCTIASFAKPLAAENEALKRERDIYKKALEIYSDERNWQKRFSQSWQFNMFWPIDKNGFAVAQQALKDAGDVRGKG